MFFLGKTVSFNGQMGRPGREKSKQRNFNSKPTQKNSSLQVLVAPFETEESTLGWGRLDSAGSGAFGVAPLKDWLFLGGRVKVMENSITY